jgi:hypothetical protein
MSGEHRYCPYCGYGYFALDEICDPHCGRAECLRRFDTMDFPCYDQDGKEWCSYPERHLPREYWFQARRTRHPQPKLL